MWFASYYDSGLSLIFLNVGFDNLDGLPFVKERKANTLGFHRHISGNSKKKETIFVFALVEFGCELLLPHYLLPKICNKNKNKNIIVIGWYGREFLYKHLVDEFWEIEEKYMFLRETVRALHHNSKTIKKLEIYLRAFGEVVPSLKLGNALLQARCINCSKAFGCKDANQICPVCFSKNVKPSFFASPQKNRNMYVPLPTPPVKARLWAKENSLPNMVGIFARNRQAYRRNLDLEFYYNLIQNLKRKGFNPVWLGEKQSVHECPDKSIKDFTNIPEARELENIISLLKECEFTIQFWTASTRLSLEANCPFLIVESPDQIYGAGQEGIRLQLLNPNNVKNKVILCNFKKVFENIEEFNSIILNGIDQMITDDYSQIIGLVDDEEYVKLMIEKQKNE